MPDHSTHVYLCHVFLQLCGPCCPDALQVVCVQLHDGQAVPRLLLELVEVGGVGEVTRRGDHPVAIGQQLPHPLSVRAGQRGLGAA